VVPVLRRTPTGARVRTPCGRAVVIRAGVALGTPVVVLDPGHGGDEDGAIGPNGVREKDLNLDVARRAQAALERDGFPTVLTRTADYRVTLDVRGEITAALRPAAFVSVHHNAAPHGPTPGPGSEMYHQVRSPASRRLGGLLYEEIVAALRPLALPWVGARDAGVKIRLGRGGRDYYGIVRRTAAAGVVGVLAELAYLDNPAEADALARDDVRLLEAEALARGIERFLTTRDPGSGYVEALPRRGAAGPGGGKRGCVDPAL
jgi:N-acetylmuramoyl-L-alanine amidase